MQLLTSASHHFFNYDMTTAHWDSIENSIEAPDVSFACLAATNLHYGLYGDFVEGLSFLSISNILEDSVCTYYGQYGELVVGFRPTSDRDCDKEDGFDVDENDDGGAADNKAADNGAADNGVADDDDGDYTEEQKKPGRLEKGSFLDKTRSSTLVTPEMTLLDILEGDTTRSPTLVTSEKTLLNTSEDDKPGTVTSDAGKKFT